MKRCVLVTAGSSFLDIIYNYNSSKPNPPTFGVAHDVGCGFGKATIELVKRFQNVVASDSNESSLAAAQKRLDLLAKNVKFSQCIGKQLGEYYPAQSADFIGAAEFIPLMESTVALSGFAKVLKPNGTLATWFYGRAHFSEREYKSTCQSLFDQIMNLIWAKVINSGGPESQATWKRAANGMASWLDNLDFSSGDWGLVQRRKWNAKSAKMGFSCEACDFEIKTTNNVRNDEEPIEIEDPEFWKGAWNIHGVMNCMYSGFQQMSRSMSSS
ncbi:MAG: hypothetical protein MMC33_008108 [Icmadophila ericetorum]|nr:hypothetical protein [Icmadophila ericetorum]